MTIKVFCGGLENPFVFDGLTKEEYENFKKPFVENGPFVGYDTKCIVLSKHGVTVSFNTSHIDAIQFE